MNHFQTFQKVILLRLKAGVDSFHTLLMYPYVHKQYMIAVVCLLV